MQTYKIRELPRGAQTIVDTVIDGQDRPKEKVTFKKMDGMYGQWFTDDGHMLIFNATFKKEGDFYIPIAGDETNI